MKHLDDTTYRSYERPGDGDVPDPTARHPIAGADAGITAHYRRLDSQSGFVTHELAGDAQRKADASGSHGHQPAGLSQQNKLPPARPPGDPRPNGAPAYYLGRPAGLWLSIFSPRRHRTAPGQLVDVFAGHRQRALPQDTGPVTGADGETVCAAPISA